GIFRKIPTFVIAGENELEFEFVDVFAAGGGIGREKIRFDVVAFNLFENLVRTVLIFILGVKNGVDEVFMLEGTNAVLPAESGEDGAVMESGLAVEVELGGPPGGGAVFKLGP